MLLLPHFLVVLIFSLLYLNYNFLVSNFRNKSHLVSLIDFVKLNTDVANKLALKHMSHVLLIQVSYVKQTAQICLRVEIYQGLWLKIKLMLYNKKRKNLERHELSNPRMMPYQISKTCIMFLGVATSAFNLVELVIGTKCDLFPKIMD